MKKYILLLLSFLSFSIFFSSCYDPIFYEINNDVKPEAGTITGIVRSIARYNVNNQEYLVTASDNGINYKPVDAYDSTTPEYAKHGCWISYKTYPEGFKFHKYDYYGAENHVGEQIVKIISDSDYIYLVTFEYRNNEDRGSSEPSKAHLYATKISELDEDGITWKASTWKEVFLDGDSSKTFLPFAEYKDFLYSAFNIFSTNSVQKDHRFAYVRCGGISNKSYTGELKNPVYYKLYGDSLTAISVVNFDSFESYNGVNSAVWFDGDVKFFNTPAVQTNESYTNLPTKIYFGKDKTLCYYDIQEKEIKEGLSAGATISCLTVCSDSILIGRASYTSVIGGIKKAVLDENGIPGADIATFETNAEIKLKSDSYILTLLNEDPAKKELDCNLFASIYCTNSTNTSAARFDNVGLWSYYPSRGNWNKE